MEIRQYYCSEKREERNRDGKKERTEDASDRGMDDGRSGDTERQKKSVCVWGGATTIKHTKDSQT